MQISLLDYKADYFILHLNKIHSDFLLSKDIMCEVIIESRHPLSIYKTYYC